MKKRNDMKQFIVLILSFVFSISLFAKENRTYIGILYEKIFTTKKEAQIGSVIWTKYMAQRGYENVNIKFYEDENVLITDYLNNKVSSILGTYQMYYKNKSILEKVSKKRWIPAVTKNVFEQFYLIKNRNSKITLDNLDNKILYYKNNMGKIWLESLVLKKYNKPISKVFSKIVDIKKPQKLIFNIFFNHDELSVVSKKLYDDMIELNPQINKKVVILKKSKFIFLSGIGFTSKKRNPYYENMIMDVKKDIDEKGSVKLSESISIHNFYNITNKELKPLDSFFNEYLNLKKLYK